MTKETKSVFKLGITGGIGSGKTSVCRVFDILGIPVFSADSEARDIMDHNADIRKGINIIAGKDLYPGGNLDRMQLASIIFNDITILAKVNNLVHPAVFDHFMKWTEKQLAPYIIMEAAILFESGADKLVNRVATVTAPESERIDRVIKRNRLTITQVTERIKNQMDDDARIKLSDYVIYNSENDMIIPAILNIHNEILTIIKKQS